MSTSRTTRWRVTAALLLSALVGLLSPLGVPRAGPTPPSRHEKPGPVAAIAAAACGSTALHDLASAHGGGEPCRQAAGIGERARPALAFERRLAASPAATGDGVIVDRLRIATIGPVGLDLVAYLSSGLIVGGLLCYVDDGQPRSTVIHLHGGFGGIFVNPDGGDVIGTCYRWAAGNGRNAFVPSFRGQDGGQGVPEVCLGEADDVAAAAVMLRGLDEVDPDRMALVGGSMGGCVALRAGALIPDLRAVVAIAPPTDWKALTDFHREKFKAQTEKRCDDTTMEWGQGGTAFADTIDFLICGHAGCSDEEYALRSPLPSVFTATNPTLVLVAGRDNLIPAEQQLLWPALRNLLTGQVVGEARDRCDPPSSLPLAQDVLLYVPDAFHMMEEGPIVSGLIYLSEQLDAQGASSGPPI